MRRLSVQPVKLAPGLAPTLAVMIVAALAFTSHAVAHHSFAVFFDSDKNVSVTGEVTDFMFRNPHAVIKINVKGTDGKPQEWRAETNSPSILMRRGWTANSLKTGETITLEGWPARDGSRYLRMRQATRANGEVIGKPFEFSEN